MGMVGRSGSIVVERWQLARLFSFALTWLSVVEMVLLGRDAEVTRSCLLKKPEIRGSESTLSNIADDTSVSAWGIALRVQRCTKMLCGRDG